MTVVNNQVFIIILSVILLSFVGFVIWNNTSNQDATSTDTDSIQMSEHLWGPSPATEDTVILQEAYSLGCPSCASFHENTLKQLREEYKDKIIFQPLHFPLTARFPNALYAHRAVEAASKQGEDKFWALHDKLLEERDLWTIETTHDPEPQVLEFAQELGLDIEQFKTDLKSLEVHNIIKADENYLKENYEVNATPTFILNGEKVDNSQFGNIETARATLDAALGIEAESDLETEEDNETEADPENSQTP